MRRGEHGEEACVIAFHVIGTPAPKGSSRAINVSGGSDVNQARQRSWSADVQAAAVAAMQGRAPIVEMPLVVELVFHLLRPGGHWSKRGGLRPRAPSAPAVKPDLDKLARCTLDALTGIVFDDDSRIVELSVRKVYCAPNEAPGASIACQESSNAFSDLADRVDA
jgi:crossover junction endodeoxyribonuclease RusA